MKCASLALCCWPLAFAFSEQAINQLSELQNQKTMELCIRHAEREFANATIRGQSIEFLLNNQII